MGGCENTVRVACCRAAPGRGARLAGQMDHIRYLTSCGTTLFGMPLSAATCRAVSGGGARIAGRAPPWAGQGEDAHRAVPGGAAAAGTRGARPHPRLRGPPRRRQDQPRALRRRCAHNWDKTPDRHSALAAEHLGCLKPACAVSKFCCTSFSVEPGASDVLLRRHLIPPDCCVCASPLVDETLQDSAVLQRRSSRPSSNPDWVMAVVRTINHAIVLAVLQRRWGGR